VDDYGLTSKKIVEHFIPRFSAMLHDRYPLPEEWTVKLACTTLASVIPRNARLKTKYGFNRCNIWNVVVTESGFFKSAPFDNVIKLILNYVDEKTDQYHILPSTASSIEGIIDRAIDEEVKLEGLMFQDELTAWLKEAGEGKKYSPTFEYYSRMWDGWLDPRETRTVKVRRPIPVYVCLIGATTPKYLFKDPKIFIDSFFQGVGNRIDYTIYTANLPEDCRSDDLFPRERWSEEDKLDRELKEFANALLEYMKCKYPIYLDEDAKRISAEFLNKTNELINKIGPASRFSFKRSYYVRDWQKSLKYAQIHAISRGLKKWLHAKQVIVESEDIEFGIKVILRNRKNFEQLVEKWIASVPEKEEVAQTDIRIVLRYLNIIKEYKLISSQKLAYEVGAASRDNRFYNIIKFLLESGCISQISGQRAREEVMLRGPKWCEKMLIKLPVRRAPILYRYEKDLERRS